MSEAVVGILGLLCIVAIVVTLFQSRTQPAIAFIVYPTILGLILVLAGRHSFDDLAAMIKAGLDAAMVRSSRPSSSMAAFMTMFTT